MLRGGLVQMPQVQAGVAGFGSGWPCSCSRLGPSKDVNSGSPRTRRGGINALLRPHPARSGAARRSRAQCDARPPISIVSSCGNRASVCACAPSSVPKRQEQTRARPPRQSAAEWRPSSCRCPPFHDRPRLVKSTSRPAPDAPPLHVTSCHQLVGALGGMLRQRCGRASPCHSPS